MMSHYDNSRFPAETMPTPEQSENMRTVLEQNFAGIGGLTVLLTDTTGSIIAKHNNGTCEDTASLAALASANCAATDLLANLLGQREFHFHLFKGRSKSAHFIKVDSRLLLVIVSAENVPTGMLRLKIGETILKIRELSESVRDSFLRLTFPAGLSEAMKAA